MTLALGCIADDYTGASDLANTLTRCGLRTVQTIGVPAGDLALPDVDAGVAGFVSVQVIPDGVSPGSTAKVTTVCDHSLATYRKRSFCS